jgi:hypothetical protein
LPPSTAGASDPLSQPCGRVQTSKRPPMLTPEAATTSGPSVSPTAPTQRKRSHQKMTTASSTPPATREQQSAPPHRRSTCHEPMHVGLASPSVMTVFYVTRPPYSSSRTRLRSECCDHHRVDPWCPAEASAHCRAARGDRGRASSLGGELGHPGRPAGRISDRHRMHHAARWSARPHREENPLELTEYRRHSRSNPNSFRWGRITAPGNLDGKP